MKEPRFILYTETYCPYCQRVLRFLPRSGLTEGADIELRSRDDNKEELVSRAGKTQIPYLVDTQKNVEMHESNDIIAYLQSQVVS